MKHIRRLGVGTVQFGTTYGIANLYGQVGRPTVVDILKLARAAGVELIDTAAMYGQAEEVLSDVLKKVPGFQVVTKTLTSAVGIEAVTVLEPALGPSRQSAGDAMPSLPVVSIAPLIVPSPATVVIMPVETVILRITLLRLSATYILSAVSSATPKGYAR